MLFRSKNIIGLLGLSLIYFVSRPELLSACCAGPSPEVRNVEDLNITVIEKSYPTKEDSSPELVEKEQVAKCAVIADYNEEGLLLSCKIGNQNAHLKLEKK